MNFENVKRHKPSENAGKFDDGTIVVIKQFPSQYPRMEAIESDGKKRYLFEGDTPTATERVEAVPCVVVLYYPVIKIDGVAKVDTSEILEETIEIRKIKRNVECVMDEEYLGVQGAKAFGTYATYVAEHTVGSTVAGETKTKLIGIEYSADNRAVRMAEAIKAGAAINF